MSITISENLCHTFSPMIMPILSLGTAMTAPVYGNVCAGDDPGIYGGIVSDTFFAAVGRNKRRVARRLKFHIKEQALRTRAVDYKSCVCDIPVAISQGV